MINKIEIWSPCILKEQDKNESFVNNINFDDLSNEINF